MYKKRHKIKKKRSILKSRYFWLSILIVLFLGGLFYLFIFSSLFQIKDVRISGNEKVSSDKVRDIIEKNLSTSILFWETKSIFLVNVKNIDSLITEDFPRIKEVSVKRDFPSAIVSKIKERSPVADWCSEEECFYLDREGIAFAKTEKETNVMIKPISFNNFSLGDSLIEKKKIQSILTIAKEINLDVKEYLFEVEKLTVKLSNWEIYFNLKENVEDQLFNLNIVLEKKIPSNKRENLEYIDLRFGNRVFVSPPLVDIVNED